MPPTPLQEAHALLGDLADTPVPRARRIAGLYARLYLEDPLLHQWGGLAAFVARHIHLAMEAANGVLEDFMATGNLLIYDATMPAFLRLQAGAPPVGALSTAMHTLRQADAAALGDLAEARRLADDALLEMAVVEQRDIVQPAYDQLGDVATEALQVCMRFRLGMADDAPLLAFDGDEPRSASQRIAWAVDEVLPAFRAFRDERPDLLRAELDRLRRWARV